MTVRHKVVNGVRIEHGHARAGYETSIYRTWRSMISRCHNPNQQSYKRYGGRGIFVCDRWRNSFLDFLQDVGPKPSSEHSLERIDNDRGYEPANVRWATRAEQQRNTSRNRIVAVDGMNLPMSDAAALYGLTFETLDSRLRLGWSVERALQTPVRKSPVHPGVEYVTDPGLTKPYRARRMLNGKRVSLGVYATETEAIAAYEAANCPLNEQARQRQARPQEPIIGKILTAG